MDETTRTPFTSHELSKRQRALLDELNKLLTVRRLELDSRRLASMTPHELAMWRRRVNAHLKGNRR